jgi:ABC-type Fe3+ transport system permease subunit
MAERTTQIFTDTKQDFAFRAKWYTGRAVIYGQLILWSFICLFPIYWTVTTSFKMAPDVMQGHLVPWVDFEPRWRGWRSLGLSPNTIFEISTVREEFLKRFMNSVITSVSASALAVMLGSLDHLGQRLGVRRDARLFGGVWPEPVYLPLRVHEKQRYLVLLPQPDDPAAGRARIAVPGSLQGT